MSLLVRKIEYSKWRQRNILDGDQPSADAITNCMKTKLNKLSVWSIVDENEREDAVLAIAAGQDHLDTIDILLIDCSMIREKKLHLDLSPGITPYHAFKTKHLDVANLDYNSLGTLAEVTVESIRQKRHKRFREKELINILTNGVQAGKVQWSELKPNVQKKVPNNDLSTTI